GGPMFDVMPAELNGDEETDLLFARFADASGFVRLVGVPALDSYDPALNWRLADVSGDGRLDLIQLQAMGSSIRTQTTISPQSGASLPGFHSQDADTSTSNNGIPSAGFNMARWLVADVDSPDFRGADGRADLVYVGVDLSGNGPASLKRLALISNGDG